MLHRVLLILCFPVFVHGHSSTLFCEATLAQYKSLSLFCQETDSIQNYSYPKPLPNITEALGNVTVKLLKFDELETPAENYTDIQIPAFISVDPMNVTELTIWAHFDEIPADCFQSFLNLLRLGLAQYSDSIYRPVKIANDAFRGLPKLESLSLRVNLSEEGIPEAVSQLDHLVSLGFSEPDFKTEFRTGQNWPQLRHLTMKDSPNMALAADAFQFVIDSLNELELNNVALEGILSNSISDLRNLTRIEIERTLLREIPQDAFLNSVASIELIRMSTNRISDLHPTSFRGLSKLKVLQLSYNEIDVLPASIFDDLVSLEILNLRGNKISSLPANIFGRNPNLRTLDLDENPIGISRTELLNKAKFVPSVHIVEPGKNKSGPEGNKVPNASFLTNLNGTATINHIPFAGFSLIAAQIVLLL